MKKIFTLLFAMVGLICLHAQTVYSENMGTTASGNPLVSVYTGWQNTAPITYGGTGSARTTTASTGYTAASGSVNVFLSGVGGQTFQINGINTSAYASSGLQLNFGWLTTTATAVITVETSIDNGTTWVPLTVPANPTTNWTYKTITSGIPSSANLSLRFTGPVTGGGMRVDDVSITYVSATCALSPAAATTICDASTLGLDTYTITIPYTGGGTATYSVTATSGTVGGNNPSTVAAGNIVITGTVEGVNNTITITGGTCNYTIAVNAPTNGCKPINALPVTEHFNYTAGQALQAQQMWTSLNSGDNITVAAGNLSYPGITPSGNSVTFDGAGLDAFLPFTDTTSGAVYASFAFSVTDLTNVTADLTSTYFAVLTDQLGAFTNARLYIRKSGTQYQFGLGAGTTPDTWSTNLYNVNTVQYLRIGYDFATNKIALFENQVTPGTPSITVTPAAPITAIGGFALRQDAAATTPFIQIDELTINNNVIVLGVSDLSNLNSNFVRNTMVNDEINFGAKSDVKVYNMNGQVVKSASVSANKNLNVSDLQNGMYIVTGMVDGTPVSQKILKK